MTNIETTGDRRKIARKKPTMTAAEFLSWWFPRGARIALASYANDRSEAKKYPPREKVITKPADDIAGFIDGNDTEGRACYFAVNPILRSRRGKDYVACIVGLHADIDFHGVVESPKAIKAAIAKLKYKPTATVFSGNGMHVYYRYTRPLPPEQIPSHEELLQRFCTMLAADKSAAEVARVLRLPGSHNSKNGEWKEVCVVDELSSWRSYSVDALDAWIEDTHPVLTYKELPPDVKPVRIASNPFQEFAYETRALTSTAEMTNDERLAAMAFHGVHKNGIDDSYAHIVGSMVAQGASLDECLEYLLEPTRRVYERGRRRGDSAWNRRRAVREITGKYRRFKRKDAKKNGHD